MREREKSFSGYVIKFFNGQRQIDVYLHCLGRYKPFNIVHSLQFLTQVKMMPFLN